jgi:O-antigen ligase
MALFVVWATDQAGYPLTHWAPGGLIVLALLGIAASIVPPRLAEIPLSVRIAALALAAYTALSFLSILWAGSPGDAWEGANRTLLYLLVFVLFAAWPQRGASAALVLVGWTLAMIGLAAFTALHVAGGDIAAMLPDGRLLYPTGYPNANAAQWLMAFWPALLLARSERLWWGLRGALAGGTVLLGSVALLSQSRGSLYATPVMLALVFALLPGRLRTFAVLAPIVAAIGAVAPAVLRVSDRVNSGGGARAALHSATVEVFAASLLVGVVVAGAAALERARPLSRAWAARVRKGVGAVAVLTLVAILAGGWVAAGNPLRRLEHGWQSFKGGYATTSHGGSRLTSGLGSNRYDFYRVALNEFAAHPLVGIGADNYAQPYLRHGRSLETPHYPHSVELRTLTETGLAGALLALVGLGAALSAGGRAMRGTDALARAVAAAALAGFAYWAVHGSVDWFWEFAGLGAPAFALLGLSCALAPPVPFGMRGPLGMRGQAPPADSIAAQPELARPASTVSRLGGQPPAHRIGMRRAVLALAALAAVVLVAASFAAPWLSERQVQRAAREWPTDPARAYARLNDAARLNPLSDEPYLVAGSIALRFGDLIGADREFALALGRVPDDAYAMLERGAIASTTGHGRTALALLERAAQLNPRDPLTRRALLLARGGERVDVGELNRSILREAQQLS